MRFNSYKEKAFKVLRKDIISCRLAPGQPLNERELSERLKISKTPIREAIQLLYKEGLINFVPRKGAFVTSVTLNDVWEIVQIREGLEALAAGAAASRHDRKGLSDFEKEFQSLALAQPRDYGAMREAGERFHIHLIQMTENQRLIDLHQSVNGQMSRMRNLFHAKVPSYYYDRSLLEHIGILEAVKRGDSGKAEELMRAHIRGYWERLKEAQ
jgi:DNA-binding GntR family transcriptional regulator